MRFSGSDCIDAVPQPTHDVRVTLYGRCLPARIEVDMVAKYLTSIILTGNVLTSQARSVF